MASQAVYYCTQKRCRAYHREVTAMQPGAFRAATGSFIRCAECNDVLRWLRNQEDHANE